MEVCKYKALDHLSDKKRKVPIFSCDISPDGKYLLTGALDCRIRLWSLDSSSSSSSPVLVSTLSRHEGAVLCVRFHPQRSDIFVSSSDDKLVLVWERQGGDERGKSGNLVNIQSSALALPPVSTAMIESHKASPATAPSVTYSLKHRLANHASDVLAVSFTPDGNQLVSCSLDNSLVIYDVPAEYCSSRGDANSPSSSSFVMKQRLDFSCGGSNLKGFSMNRLGFLVAVGSNSQRAVWIRDHRSGNWQSSGTKQSSSASGSGKGKSSSNPSDASACFFQRPCFLPESNVICLPGSCLSSLPTASLEQLLTEDNGHHERDIGDERSRALMQEINDMMTMPVRWKHQSHLVGHLATIESTAVCPLIFEKSCSSVEETISRMNTTPSKIAMIALGCQDGSISLWTNVMERPIVVFNGIFEDCIFDLCWTGDGKSLVAVSNDGTVAFLKFDWLEGIKLDGNGLKIATRDKVMDEEKEEPTLLIPSNNLPTTTASNESDEVSAVLRKSFNRIFGESSSDATPFKINEEEKKDGKGIPKVNPVDNSLKQQVSTLKDGRRRITPILVTSSENVNLLSPKRKASSSSAMDSSVLEKRVKKTDHRESANESRGGGISLLVGSVHRKMVFASAVENALSSKQGNVLVIPVLDNGGGEENEAPFILAKYRAKQWIEIKNCNLTGTTLKGTQLPEHCLISLQVVINNNSDASKSIIRWQDLLIGHVCTHAVASKSSLAVIASRKRIASGSGAGRVLVIYDLLTGRRKSPILLLPVPNIAYLGVSQEGRRERLLIVTTNGYILCWCIESCKFVAQIDVLPAVEYLDAAASSGAEIVVRECRECFGGSAQQFTLTLVGNRDKSCTRFLFDTSSCLWSVLDLAKEECQGKQGKFSLSRDKLLLAGLFAGGEAGRKPDERMIISADQQDPTLMLDLLWKSEQQKTVSKEILEGCRLSALESYLCSLDGGDGSGDGRMGGDGNGGDGSGDDGSGDDHHMEIVSEKRFSEIEEIKRLHDRLARGIHEKRKLFQPIQQ